MPILQNPRHEAFAQYRAKGARLVDAYEDAGFVPDSSHPGRLAAKPEVAERIGELRAALTLAADANPLTLIGAFMRVAKASEDLSTPAGMKEARLTLLEARQLAKDLASDRMLERHMPGH